VGRPFAVLVVALVLVEGAAAHAPTTAIGRAVAAFGSVPVSYDPGAIVSDVQAANFGLLSVQAEPVDAGPPWGWIGAALVVVALGGLVAFDRLVRRRP
jgi:hypothetical protein